MFSKKIFVNLLICCILLFTVLCFSVGSALSYDFFDTPEPQSPGTRGRPGPTINTLTPVLEWTDDSSASSFLVQIRTYPHTENDIIKEDYVSGNSYKVSSNTLQCGEEYSWRVSRVVWGGQPHWSESLFFTIGDEPAEAITLGALNIGERVVDPAWEWEHRTDNDYSGTGVTKPVTWIVVAKDHYGSNSGVTLLAEELIGRHDFDNSTDRDHEYAENGFNHWGESGTGNATRGLRPWLNSTGIHSEEGFYRAFSASFKSAIVPVILPNKHWETGNPYFTQDRVFTPSSTELGDTDHYSTYQIGSVYSYFSSTSLNRRAQLEDSKIRYWTRSPGLSRGSSFGFIGQYGSFGSYGGSFRDGYGVRPALNLKSDNLVSAAPNADGVYELDFYSAPQATKLIKWEITNNWEDCILRDLLYSIHDRAGHKIDSCIDVFIDGDPIFVEARLSTDEYIGFNKVEYGHYRQCLNRSEFSMEKYQDYLFDIILFILTYGKNATRIDIPDEYEDPLQLKIEELLIDGESFTQSETGQKLPELVPAFRDAASRWLEDQGTFIIAQSPVDLLITNSKGEKIGALYEDGQFSEEINEIDGAFYGGQGLDMQFVYIPTYDEKPNIEVKGRGSGTYTLSILAFDNDQITSKMLTDNRLLETISFEEINIDEGSIHKYEICRKTLNQGAKGINKQVDSNGDGNFEDVYTAGLTKAPDNPYPINNQSNVSTKPELRWQGGDVETDKELKYSIFFGTEEMPTFKKIVGPYPGDKDIITYEPGLLEPGTTYYWGVAVTDNYGITVGSEIWKFTTIDSDSEFHKIGLYDPSDGVFHLKGATPYRYGPRNSDWLPLTGDWNGDGYYKTGLYDPSDGVFHLEEITPYRYGPRNSDWLSLSGDWDGDGNYDVGLYDPADGVFHIKGQEPFRYGPRNSEWLPVSGDWNGDGSCSVGLYDPSDGVFHLSGEEPFRFGPRNSSWLPLTGDWNGTAICSVGLQDPSDGVFHLKGQEPFRFGPRNSEWLPVSGRW